jgi:predicted Rossmann fold nucleotide-binding protein DprA/Smf involved in DNA uptake
MRIAIVGCRPAEHGSTGWDTWVSIAADVEAFVPSLPAGTVVVSGGARGVDSRAIRLARTLGYSVVEHLPDYDAHGGKAPLVRNTLIVADADEVHAWPAPWSRGTWDTIRKARAAGKPVTVHEVKP